MVQEVKHDTGVVFPQWPQLWKQKGMTSDTMVLWYAFCLIYCISENKTQPSGNNKFKNFLENNLKSRFYCIYNI